MSDQDLIDFGIWREMDADTNLDAVVPAVDALLDLRNHETEAVRQVAAGALVRLARQRPEAVADV